MSQRFEKNDDKGLDDDGFGTMHALLVTAYAATCSVNARDFQSVNRFRKQEEGIQKPPQEERQVVKLADKKNTVHLPASTQKRNSHILSVLTNPKTVIIPEFSARAHDKEMGKAVPGMLI